MVGSSWSRAETRWAGTHHVARAHAQHVRMAIGPLIHRRGQILGAR